MVEQVTVGRAWNEPGSIHSQVTRLIRTCRNTEQFAIALVETCNDVRTAAFDLGYASYFNNGSKQQEPSPWDDAHLPNADLLAEWWRSGWEAAQREFWEHVIPALDAGNWRAVQSCYEGTGRTCRPGIVYLLGCDEGYHKIGLTKDLTKRLDQLGTIPPFEFEVLSTFPADDCCAAELELHDFYRDKRVRGEWFKLAEEDIAYISKIRYYFLGLFRWLKKDMDAQT